MPASPALIWSLNGPRRHLTKGQRAILAAMRYFNLKKTIEEVAQDTHLAIGNAGRAVTILRWAPDLAEPWELVDSTTRRDGTRR